MRVVMKKTTLVKKTEQVHGLATAEDIANRIKCTSRYILQLAAAGKIPSIRIGYRCVRFEPRAVAEALGFQWEGGTK